MGRYYNPATDVKEGRTGRQISPLRHNDYRAAMDQLREGEHLYALMDLGIRHNAVCVDEESEFVYFYGLYAQGHYLTFTLYALTEEQHQTTAT